MKEHFHAFITAVDFCSITLTQIGYGTPDNFVVTRTDVTFRVSMIYLFILHFLSSLYKGYIIQKFIDYKSLESVEKNIELTKKSMM